jgi:6-phosphofructokinase 1
MATAYVPRGTFPAVVRSPLGGPFVDSDARTLATIESTTATPIDPKLAFERAGARASLAFDPARTRAAIVTAGGLCPGTNNVVRALVLELYHGYGVRSILGFRFGFEGMSPASGLDPIALTPEVVRHAHRLGGTLLGTSRLRREAAVLADVLQHHAIDVLFTVGGNGTLRAARSLVDELARRGATIAVVAVPKTIDDDIGFVDKTFGFDTAVEHARAAIDAAHAEAIAVRNGIGVVKLMGRDAGFVAAHATIASGEANFCVLPEFPFPLAGERGLLAGLERRLQARGHAVIVIAEGCGKRLITPSSERDASGNPRYASAALDIGPYLCDAVKRHFAAASVTIQLKYIDPSYLIRAAPANTSDAFYCTALGRHAVHAAMAGRTGVLVGRCHGVYAHIPMELAIERTPRVDAALWQAVCEVTGQPELDAPPH